MRRTDARFAVLVLLLALLLPAASSAQKTSPARPATAKPAQAVTPPKPAALTRDQMRNFLLTAEVVTFKEIGKGVTRPKRLTLTKDGLTHDAAFQSVDEQRASKSLGGGARQTVTELNFVDAYRYNLAAYALADLIGLDHMMPVHVERKWRGQTGSLSWWVETLMDEGERVQKKIEPANSRDWNEQMYRMRVFAALVRDTDRNLGNVLITPDWKVMMIDFTRAFRRQTELIYAKDLARIDRKLLTSLGSLTKDSVQQAVGRNLTGAEIDSTMERRDKLIAHFQALVAEKGAAAVLY